MLVGGGDGKEAVPVGESSKTAVPRPRTTSFALENGHCSGNGASGPPPAVRPSVGRASERASGTSRAPERQSPLSIHPSQSVVVGDAGGGPGLIPFFVNASTAASFTRHACAPFKWAGNEWDSRARQGETGIQKF